MTTGSASTFAVTARLDEGADEVRSGMAADVTFRFEDAEGRGGLVLPLLSVGEDQQGRFVFVVEPAEGDTGIVHRRPVEVGELVDGGVQVVSGVEVGELVATAGVRVVWSCRTVQQLPPRIAFEVERGGH